MKRFIIIFLFFLLLTVVANDKPVYKIFNYMGEEVNFSDIVNSVSDCDVIFFGELHDNPIAHWLEYELAKALYAKKKGKIIFGAEMFESDNQLIFSEYLDGQISEKNFLKEMRLWNNYKTDYRPLVEFAKKNNIKFIATNIPRRYASIVSMKGFDGLSQLSSEARKFIAPFPIKYDSTVACYKNMLQMTGMPGMHNKNMNNFPKAQAIKDATMAYFINKNLEKDKLFIHFNGSYHSDNHEGIVWHLKNSNSNLKIKTITTVLQNNIDKIDERTKKLADFIIVVIKDITRTY